MKKLSDLATNREDIPVFAKDGKPQRNFEFDYEGHKMWWSPSMTVCGIVLAKNSSNEWCVLANKRGPGCPDNNGKWNCPCGYYEANRTSFEETVNREVWEETGIDIPKEDWLLYGIKSGKTGANPVIRFIHIEDAKKVEEFKFNLSHMEKNEVEEVRFIKLSEINQYQWAFGHDKILNVLNGSSDYDFSNLKILLGSITKELLID